MTVNLIANIFQSEKNVLHNKTVVIAEIWNIKVGNIIGRRIRPRSSYSQIIGLD